VVQSPREHEINGRGATAGPSVRLEPGDRDGERGGSKVGKASQFGRRSGSGDADRIAVTGIGA